MSDAETVLLKLYLL